MHLAAHTSQWQCVAVDPARETCSAEESVHMEADSCEPHMKSHTKSPS